MQAKERAGACMPEAPAEATDVRADKQQVHTASSGRAGAGPAVPRPGAGDGDPETGSRGGHGAS